MKVKLKPIGEQVVVITGASSGIGLATARMAAQKGARVVLVARGEESLQQAVAQIRADSGVGTYVAADVAEPEAMERVAALAADEFGGFDTWINCAAVAMYGRLDEIPLEDQRQLFETNFWGIVHGCLAALPQLKRTGGALINVGSIISDLAIPLQGVYSASKHAVKGYTNALRIELAESADPVSVTLIKPAAIDTPYYEHARNFMDEEPTPPPPVYAPETVARAIIACAERPVREVVVGGAGQAMIAAASLAPRIADRVMEHTMFGAQKSGRPARRDRHNLYDSLDEPASERGAYSGPVLERSLYTGMALHPGRTVLAAAGVGLVVAAGLRAIKGR